MSLWHGKTASDVMSSPAETLHESTSLRDAARAMSDLQISGVPVVNAAGTAVGVVSLNDIVGFLANDEGPVHDGGVEYPGSDVEADDAGEQFERSIGQRDLDWLRDTSVSEVMTGELFAVAPSAPLAEVAACMEERRIHRVVVAHKDRPVGVISTLDLLRALAAPVVR